MSASWNESSPPSAKVLISTASSRARDYKAACPSHDVRCPQSHVLEDQPAGHTTESCSACLLVLDRTYISQYKRCPVCEYRLCPDCEITCCRKGRLCAPEEATLRPGVYVMLNPHLQPHAEGPAWKPGDIGLVLKVSEKQGCRVRSLATDLKVTLDSVMLRVVWDDEVTDLLPAVNTCVVLSEDATRPVPPAGLEYVKDGVLAEGELGVVVEDKGNQLRPWKVRHCATGRTSCYSSRALRRVPDTPPSTGCECVIS